MNFPAGEGTIAPAYYPAINTLRALAILLVLFQHYGHYEFVRHFSLGNAGVDIFFVISGFLITGNLLYYKATTGIRDGLKIFYARRILRLMPLYYLYFCIAAYLTREQMSWNTAGSLVFYYSNFLLMSGGELPWPFRHFWSLAVEEQFYVLWPLVIFLIPDRFMKAVICAAIGFGIGFGILNTYVIGIYLGTYVHPASCLQALALGGLLAVLHARGSKLVGAISARGPLLLGVAALAFGYCAARYREQEWLFTLLRSSAAGFAFVAISMIVQPGARTDGKLRNLYARLVDSSALQLIGRISYGIYVYHILVMKALEPVLKKIFGENSADLPFAIGAPLVCTAATICLAYLSFRFFEAPFNKLKGRFAIGDARKR